MTASLEIRRSDGSVVLNLSDRLTQLIGVYDVTVTSDWQFYDVGLPLIAGDYFVSTPINYISPGVERAPMTVRFTGNGFEYRRDFVGSWGATPDAFNSKILLFKVA